LGCTNKDEAEEGGLYEYPCPCASATPGLSKARSLSFSPQFLNKNQNPHSLPNLARI
jgi:hypothetical protein